MYDLMVKNGILATETGPVQADLAITDGKVAAWLQPGSGQQAHDVVDAEGKYILPGFVDMHFHCRVPGRDDREDFDTATQSAAKGGVTTFIEMPIAKPSPHNAETLQNRIDYAKDKAVIDYGFYGAGATGDAKKAWELAQAGAMGFKMFLHSPPKGREDEFQDLCAPGTEQLYTALEANAKTGLLTCVHAEDDGIIRARTAAYGKGEANRYLEQFATRIPEAEELAIFTAGICAKASKARLHICHISSEEGVQALRYLKSLGISISGESCPPYLWMDEDLLRQFGTYAKVNPPIRGGRHKAALQRGLQDGTLDAIASDHAPFLPKEKEVSDFLAAPSGMPGVEFFGPAILDQVLRGTISLYDAVRLASAAPARLLGIYGTKGCLQVGADGDFVLFDGEGTMTVDITKSFSKSKMSLYPYHAKTYRGKITATYVRGQMVYRPEEITVSNGYGKFLPGPAFKRS